MLITSPSLNEDQNVSGISSIVREIVKYGDCDFVFFAAGRRDKDRFGVFWIFRQLILPFRYLSQVLGRNIDLIHINTTFAPPAIIRDFVLTILARFFGYPLLLHVHGGKFMQKEFRGVTLNWLCGEMLYAADRVLVLNEAERNRIARRWKGLEPLVLPNAVDVQMIGYKPKLNPVSEIIYLGRIDRAKGLTEIHEACRSIRDLGLDFRFKCYGAGPETEAFTTAMEITLGDSFQYGGILRGQEKLDALAKADIFVLPSYFEGLPMSLLEAMAAKCVVVASDVGSIGSVVEDGVNGFLVAPRDAGQLAEKLQFLLSGKADWKAIRDRARKTIEENHSIENYVGELGSHYVSTVGPRVIKTAAGNVTGK